MSTFIPGWPSGLSTSGAMLSRVSRDAAAANGDKGGLGATAHAMACADEAMRCATGGHGDLANAVALGRRVMDALDGASSEADTQSARMLPFPSERAESVARLFLG